MKHRINEDKPPITLPIVISSQLKINLEKVCNYNFWNSTAIENLIKHILWIANHFSQYRVAFDYSNQFIHKPNGVVQVPREYAECEMEYAVITVYDKNTKEPISSHVEIINIWLTNNDFGLEIPNWLLMCENNNKAKRIRLTESQLHRLFNKCIK